MTTKPDQFTDAKMDMLGIIDATIRDDEAGRQALVDPHRSSPGPLIGAATGLALAFLCDLQELAGINPAQHVAAYRRQMLDAEVGE